VRTATRKAPTVARRSVKEDLRGKARRADNVQISAVPANILQRSSNCACGGDCPRCDLSGLEVSRPRDAEEQEAERVAEQVVLTSERGSMRGVSPGVPTIQRRHWNGVLVSRQAESEVSSEEELIDRKLGGYYRALARLLGEDVSDGEEQKRIVAQGLEELQRIFVGPADLDVKQQTLEALEGSIRHLMPGQASASQLRQSVQRREVSPRRSAVPDVGLGRGVRNLHGRGQPLAPTLRAYFEPRLGQDFAGVRLHTESTAASLATSLNARAFTIGGDIAFAAGQYDPWSRDGLRLLAHELTHTVQQGAVVPLSEPVSSGVARGFHNAGGFRVMRAMNAACAGTSRWPGNIEHLMIESWYASVTNPLFGEAEFSIPLGNPSGTGVGFADLVDTSIPAIYEIKPWAWRASGVAQVERYRDAAQLFYGCWEHSTPSPSSRSRQLTSSPARKPSI
jgi:hypothetical protein